MKKLIVIIGLLVSIGSTLFSQKTGEVSSYVKYINESKLPTAKQYILDLFKQYDIVVLCERWHPEFTQYNLITDIIKDPYFKENVGVVFTEIGVSTMNPDLNKFLQRNNIPDDSVNKIVAHFQQNCGIYPIWEHYNYYYLLSSVYYANNNSKRKISLYPSDLPINWSQIKDSADYAKIVQLMFPKRDSIMAKQIIDTYERIKTTNHKKALIIMNYRHSFKKSLGKMKNCTNYLFDYFDNRIANVLINTVLFDENDNPLLTQKGKWDAAFKIANNTDCGFNFENTIFGKDSFDLWVRKNQYTYQDIFKGFVFYQPIENHKLIDNYKGLASTDFENELIRRWNLTSKVTMEFHWDYIEPNSDKSKEFIEEWNTKKENDYPKLDSLLKIRDDNLPTNK